jgi:hypothetical protein
MNPDLWEISHIYKVVVFKKTKGPPEMNYVTKHYFERTDRDDELWLK